jgi:hypothetical protein
MPEGGRANRPAAVQAHARGGPGITRTLPHRWTTTTSSRWHVTPNLLLHTHNSLAPTLARTAHGISTPHRASGATACCRTGLADGLGRLESVQHAPPPGRQAVCAARARSTQPCTHLGGARRSDGQTRLNARACRAVRSRALSAHAQAHTHTHTHAPHTHTHAHVCASVHGDVVQTSCEVATIEYGLL